MNETFHTRLKLLLADKKIKTSDLIGITDLSKQAIYDILSGRVHHYNKKFIDGIGLHTDINLDWLLLGRGTMYGRSSQKNYASSVAEDSEPYLAITKGQKEVKNQQSEEIESLNKLLEEKDNRIKDLQGQVEFLKDLLNKGK